MIMSLATPGETSRPHPAAGNARGGHRRIHALIAAAEPASRRRLRQLVGQEPDIDVIGECAGGAEGAELIQALNPEVAIIDVSMPQVDGFAVAASVSHLDSPPLFIFVSGAAEDAMNAFRVAALDCLMKPVQPDEFATAIHRARGTLARRSSTEMGHRLAALLGELDFGGASHGPLRRDDPQPAHGYLERIPVRNDERVVYVRSRDVTHFEANGNYVHLHVGKRKAQIRQTLAALEEQLDPKRFVRIHRRTIVNVDCVRELQPGVAGDFTVMLEDGTALRLSRTYREDFGVAMSRGR